MTSRNFVARRPFAVAVAFIVLMIGASDYVVWNIANGPTPSKVKAEIDRELAARAQARDRQFCAILAAVPRTPTTQAVRSRLGCLAAAKPQPTPTITRSITVTPTPTVVYTPGAPRLIVTPGPTVTVTKTPRHRPGKHRLTPKPTPTPTCSTIELDGMCLPASKGKHLGQRKHPKH